MTRLTAAFAVTACLLCTISAAILLAVAASEVMDLILGVAK